ncbi:MAG: glycine-rich domain-containing protein [Geminicoccaceae bacterium]
MVVTEPYADDPLWHDIQDVQLDEPGAAFPFSTRLARENRWPHDYALLVIDEYKRFLYLMCRAGHPVTPSIEVDQAWHLHMLYTRSYWQDLAPRLSNRSPSRPNPRRVQRRQEVQ